MKHFFFNCQAKGGTGKSMLTNLQARKNENNPRTGFIDLDSSTRTSTKQLKFLSKEGMPDRIFSVDIFDSQKRIDRERLVKVIKHFNEKDFDEVYIDFGAPESEQLSPLLKLDVNSNEFKEFETELEAKFTFNVLVCGGTSYESTFEYLKLIAMILNSNFNIVVYANMHTFREYPQQLDHLNDFVRKSKSIKKAIQFGDIDTSRSSGQTIMEVIRQGVGQEGFKNEWMARTKMKRLLAELP